MTTYQRISVLLQTLYRLRQTWVVRNPDITVEKNSRRMRERTIGTLSTYYLSIFRLWTVYKRTVLDLDKTESRNVDQA